MNQIDILKQNVYDLEKQLHEAYRKLKQLQDENIALRKQIGLLPEDNEGC